MAIIDTDVLIDFLNGDQEIREAVSKHMKSGDLATTIINQYELFKGAESAWQEDAIEDLLAKLEVYRLDYVSVRSAAGIFQDLKKSGRLIPEADILVAGVAHSRREVLLTRDRHFKKLRAIKAEIV